MHNKIKYGYIKYSNTIIPRGVENKKNIFKNFSIFIWKIENNFKLEGHQYDTFYKLFSAPVLLPSSALSE